MIMNILKNKNTFSHSFKLFKYGIRYGQEFFVWKFLWVILKTVKTILVDIMLLKFFLDAIVSGKSFYETIAYIIICVIVCFLEMYIDDWIMIYVYPITKNKVHASIHKMIFEKICCVDLEKFDDSKFYNDYIWILEKSSDQIMSYETTIFDFKYSVHFHIAFHNWTCSFNLCNNPDDICSILRKKNK